MNDLIANLLESLRGTSAGTKLVAVLSGAALLAVIGLAAVVSNRPAYRPAFLGLNDHDVASVSRALAEAGVPFEVSPGGAPYTISVDEDDRSGAFAAAYGAGALDRPLRGIAAEEGVASVFNSAEERRQGVRKKDWGEMELMLETLSFVTTASVRTSAGRTSPIERDPAPLTASVTLHTTARLTPAQEDTVARIVSKGLGVDREQLMIADQEGNTIFDGSERADGGFDGLDAQESEATHDSRLTRQANSVLDAVLGPGKAYVVVKSDWNYEASTSRSQAASGKGSVVIEETTNSTERQQPSQGGGVAGITSNVVAGENAAATPPARVDAPPAERTSQTTTKYAPILTTKEVVSDVPTLVRLSVALFLDESIQEDRAVKLESNVRAAVGYDESRGDSFSVATFTAPSVPESTQGAGTTVEEPSESNPMVDKLLRRGVEIVTALVFVVLLLKSLKTSRKDAKAETAALARTEEPVDAELLARARVDELLRSDPDKVGEILSAWAREEELTGSRP